MLHKMRTGISSNNDNKVDTGTSLIAYQTNKKTYCNRSRSHSIILHPSSPNSHSPHEIICCGKYTNEEIYAFMNGQNNRLERLQVSNMLKILRSWQTTCKDREQFNVT